VLQIVQLPPRSSYRDPDHRGLMHRLIASEAPKLLVYCVLSRDINAEVKYV